MMQVSMQSLDQNSMQINTAKYSGHGWGNAPVQPDPQHPTLGPVEVPWQRCRLYPGRAYKKPPRYSGKVTFVECGKSLGPTPGAETPLTPDGPDVLDGGVLLQAQRFLGAHVAVSNLLNIGRHLASAAHHSTVPRCWKILPFVA
jgi:hypothetical protein